MDLTRLAAELLDPVPVHRTLGLTVELARDGVGVVRVEVSEPLTNVIGALHSSGMTAVVDAAALAAVLSTAPDEAVARRWQPLGTEARMTFRRPVRGTARATCRVDAATAADLAGLWSGEVDRLRLTTLSTVGSEREPDAAEGTFVWTSRLAPA